MLCLDEKKQFLTSTAGKDEWIKEWCLSLHNDGWVRKQDEQQFTPKNRKPAQSFDHPGIIFFFYENICNISFRFCFVDWWWFRRRHEVYCQIISHCLCLFNGRSSSCGEVAYMTESTHVHWQPPSEGRGDPCAEGADLPIWEGCGSEADGLH